jgi:aspartate/methionine/tyrosine aminotransferase
VPPEATALAFPRYSADMPAEAFADLLRTRGSVLVAPGTCFGIEGHLRMTFGLDAAYTSAALERMRSVFTTPG